MPHLLVALHDFVDDPLLALALARDNVGNQHLTLPAPSNQHRRLLAALDVPNEGIIEMHFWSSATLLLFSFMMRMVLASACHTLSTPVPVKQVCHIVFPDFIIG